MVYLSKRKKYAWVIGSVCMALAIGSFKIFSLFIGCRADKSWVGSVFFYFIGVSVIGIWGLIKGMLEIKSGGRLAGIVGIVLNIFGIVLALFLGYGAEFTIFVCTN
jgi:hypothetical protein